MSDTKRARAGAGWRLREGALPGDVGEVREILASSGYFYEHEVAVGVELVEEALEKGSAASGYFFVFAEEMGREGRAVAYACYGPIACTAGSWDLYWIAAREEYRGRGLGGWLLRESEARIAAAGGRRVYIETSSRPLYEPTRGFYGACGYAEEARLREFYGVGDDKVIYVRSVG